MKSAVILAATGAMLAMASPIDKRAQVTTTVWDTVYVTVTAGDEQPSAAVFVESSSSAPPPAPTVAPVVSKPAPPPPPPPSTTSVAPKPTIVPVVKKPPPPPPSKAPPATSSHADVKANLVISIGLPSHTEASSAPPKSSSGSGNYGGGSDGSYQGAMLQQHNLHRANHSSSPLSWDSTLADYAKTTAQKCVFAHDMDEGSGQYGQNIASWGGNGGDSTDAGKAAITNQWYNGEESLFSGFYGQSNPGGSFEGYGHFTQLVWSGSKTVGCATVQCAPGTIFGMSSYFTVCNYGPRGNVGGEYGDNVHSPQGHASISISI